MNLLKWAPHAYQCTLWLPTENTLQNYIWWLVQVQNRYIHLSWVADPLRKKFYIHNHEGWVTLRFTYLGSCYRISPHTVLWLITCVVLKYFYLKYLNLFWHQLNFEVIPYASQVRMPWNGEIQSILAHSPIVLLNLHSTNQYLDHDMTKTLNKMCSYCLQALLAKSTLSMTKQHTQDKCDYILMYI
jgi:hypothetical protein